MIVNTLKEIPSLKNIGVIINVGTKYVTSLALLSWLKQTRIPLVLIDCESPDGSFEYFSALSKSYDFYLTKLPLKAHGHTLDYIFRELSADNVFLIDSDTELINADIIDFIFAFIEKENVFGAGFIHEGCWLSSQSQMDGIPHGYYHERMWVPFTCLKSALVKEALNANVSFIEKTIFNDFAPSQRISRFLLKRYRTRVFHNMRLPWLDIFRRSYDQRKPSYVIYDTGADIFQYLKSQKDYLFVGIPAIFHADNVLHFHGVTRSVLDSSNTNAHHFQGYDEIIQKLRTNYGFNAGII